MQIRQTKIIGIIDENVLAFGSNPLSIMVVATKTSNSPFMKANISSSSFRPFVRDQYLALGTKRSSQLLLNVFNAVIDEKTCPFRCISYEIASRITSSLKPTTFVSIGYRSNYR
jgi:hypothetical protein